VQDEGSAHSENSAEKSRFEDDIVSRGSLTGTRGGCGRAGCRPVILCEYERGEVDFMRKLDEALQCGRPRIERCRPGIHVRDVTETACERLQQLLLLSRRAKEDARFVHVFPQVAERPRQFPSRSARGSSRRGAMLGAGSVPGSVNNFRLTTEPYRM
jgi:hypothetical protein